MCNSPSKAGVFFLEKYKAMGFFAIFAKNTIQMHTLRLKEICKEKGITLNDLASQLGVSQPSISGWATGRQKPSFDTLYRLADALGVEVPELFKPREGVKMSCPYCGRTIDIQARKDEKEA